jgi:hypothetical protein
LNLDAAACIALIGTSAAPVRAVTLMAHSHGSAMTPIDNSASRMNGKGAVFGRIGHGGSPS